MYPNLALCKIASYNKQRGDEVEWASQLEEYDIIYKSKIFRFSEDDNGVYNAKKIIIGGTGYDATIKLPKEIDDCQPDLSIYPNVPTDVSYGFLSRGCPNKCSWCVVPRKEGNVAPYWDIDKVANGKKKIVLMDNNILALPDYAKEQFQKIIDKGYKVDFNQALDARLMTEEFAELMAKMKWLDSRIRFGCDTQVQVAECDKAIEMLHRHGYKGEIFLYTMVYGDIHECLSRINHWRERTMQIRNGVDINACYPHAQPYRDPYKVNTPPQWQKDIASWCNKRMCFYTTSFEDFSPRKGFRCGEYLK